MASWPSSVTYLNGTVVFSDPKNMCYDTKVVIVCHLKAEKLIEIYLLYGGHLKNSIWPPSDAFLNGAVVFLDPENIYLDIKISIVCHLATEILIDIGFYMEAILKMQYGHKSIVKKMKYSFFSIQHIVNFLYYLTFSIRSRTIMAAILFWWDFYVYPNISSWHTIFS